MDVTRFVDTSGDLPSLRVGALASALVGAVVYGYLYGLIEFVDALLDGIGNAIGSLGGWLSDELIPSVFGAALDPITTAWTMHAEWIGSLGLFGQAIAIVEVMALLWVLIVVLERALEFVRVVTP